MIYLLHFDKKYKHAGHYIGYTENLEQRLAAHRAGNGARLIEVITQAGIGFTVAGTWPGDRTTERRLHKRHGSRICPICNPKYRSKILAEVQAEDTADDLKGIV